MKIFSRDEQRPNSTKPTKSDGSKKSKSKKSAPEKASISDSAIREKLAAHVETSNTAKSQVIKKNSEALGAGFLNPEAKPFLVKKEARVAEGEEAVGPSVKESHLLLSDVKLNDPNDSNTQEKLKSVLRNGAFSFNPKEKETLERILAGS